MFKTAIPDGIWSKTRFDKLQFFSDMYHISFYHQQTINKLGSQRYSTCKLAAMKYTLFLWNISHSRSLPKKVWRNGFKQKITREMGMEGGYILPVLEREVSPPIHCHTAGYILYTGADTTIESRSKARINCWVWIQLDVDNDRGKELAHNGW